MVEGQESTEEVGSDMFVQVEGETNDGPTTTTTNAPTETLLIDLGGLWFPPKATRIVRGKVTRRGKASKVGHGYKRIKNA